MSLNQPFEGSHPALFKQFQRYLHDQFARGRRTILIIDEAQNLGSETLEELRMLSNIHGSEGLGAKVQVREGKNPDQQLRSQNLH